MRRILGGVAVTVLALTAVPAVAEEAEEVATGEATVVAELEPAADEPVVELLQPCTNTTGAEVVTPEGLDAGIDTPMPPFGETSKTFVLDLAGQPVGTRGILDVTMTWGVPVNDFDLNVDGTDSQNIQPIDEAVEQASTGTKNHCARVTVTALNFAAPVVVDTLELELGLRPR